MGVCRVKLLLADQERGHDSTMVGVSPQSVILGKTIALLSLLRMLYNNRQFFNFSMVYSLLSHTPYQLDNRLIIIY